VVSTEGPAVRQALAVRHFHSERIAVSTDFPTFRGAGRDRNALPALAVHSETPMASGTVRVTLPASGQSGPCRFAHSIAPPARPRGVTGPDGVLRASGIDGIRNMTDNSITTTRKALD